MGARSASDSSLRRKSEVRKGSVEASRRELVAKTAEFNRADASTASTAPVYSMRRMAETRRGSASPANASLRGSSSRSVVEVRDERSLGSAPSDFSSRRKSELYKGSAPQK